MEPKKVKKLVLIQETISSLSDGSMNNLRGGATDENTACLASMLNVWVCIYSELVSCEGAKKCDNGGVASDNCTGDWCGSGLEWMCPPPVTSPSELGVFTCGSAACYA